MLHNDILHNGVAVTVLTCRFKLNIMSLFMVCVSGRTLVVTDKSLATQSDAKMCNTFHVFAGISNNAYPWQLNGALCLN